MTDSLLYTIIGIIAVIAIILTIIINRKRSENKLKRTLAENWGKIPKEKIKSEDMQAISSYFTNLSECTEEPDTGANFFIDDITWNDLDMDNVFQRINNTQSTVGEEYLYSLLREPVFDKSTLEERDGLIEYFRTNQAGRTRLQLILARLGKKRHAGISDHFFNEDEYTSKRGLHYILLLAAFLLSPVVLAINFPLGIILFVASFFTNMTVYYKAKNENEKHLEQLSYLINLIVYSRKIADAGIDEYSDKLKELLKKVKGVSIKSFYQIFYNTNDVFLEPIKVIFLVELIAYESLLKKLKKYRNELRSLYETVGLLDSMLSVASYRESLDNYTVPVLHTNGTEGPIALSFKDAYHPLIKEPVVNSLDIVKPVLITGSNASGKSTFLKTAAINAILAQTIHTCLATEYKSCIFKIFTSMALKDNLSSNESYYIAEIKSLKRIFDSLDDDPVLCMIDEVLRGTNTIERIAASSEVLNRLSASNCLCIAATHDLELASILGARYGNFHFQENFQDNDIVFDYRIYPGKSTTRNAIKLLRVMGYSDDIVDSAEKRAERFVHEGKWYEIEG